MYPLVTHTTEKGNFTNEVLYDLLFPISGYNIDDLVRETRTRWLKPAEVLFILENYKEDQLTHELPRKPASKFLIYCILLHQEKKF